ncbi:MAG: hypothetical protein LBK00_04660 [Treponema sp.]|nr:hypothetical protein [Treponema sp.]
MSRKETPSPQSILHHRWFEDMTHEPPAAALLIRPDQADAPSLRSTPWGFKTGSLYNFAPASA